MVCSSCSAQDKPHMYCCSDLDKGYTDGWQNDRVEGHKQHLLIKTWKSQLIAKEQSIKKHRNLSKIGTRYPNTTQKWQWDRVKVLSHTSGFPAWGWVNKRRRPQRIWLWWTVRVITRIPRDRKKEKPHYWRGETRPCEHQNTWAKISDLIRD